VSKKMVYKWGKGLRNIWIGGLRGLSIAVLRWRRFKGYAGKRREDAVRSFVRKIQIIPEL
jgi:hypothetical protein